MKHTWVVNQDNERDGERWTCMVCGDSVGPKETSTRGVREQLRAEACPGAKPAKGSRP